MTTLRTELKETITTIQSEMNVNTTEVANVKERLNNLTELIQKEAHERAEEAATWEAQKKKREEEKLKENEDKKKMKDERRKKKK